MRRFCFLVLETAMAGLLAAGLLGCDRTEPLGDPPAAAKYFSPGLVDTRPVTGLEGSARPGWKLTWSDEFDGADGTQADPAKWVYDIGGDGWGNNELQYYTHDLANSVVRGGQLSITVTDQGASKFQCYYGKCRYTSARLTTRTKFSQKYGRFEGRMRIPRGRGMWPAFWMLGAEFPGIKWPKCGEIDIMENVGDEPSVVHGTLHGPGKKKYVDEGIGGDRTLLGGGAVADDFHVYAIEWEAAVVRFYMDDALYKTITIKDLPKGATWVWDRPFFILLNLAIGGDWPAPPDATTKIPQRLIVDYVRVYAR